MVQQLHVKFGRSTADDLPVRARRPLGSDPQVSPWFARSAVHRAHVSEAVSLGRAEGNQFVETNQGVRVELELN